MISEQLRNAILQHLFADSSGHLYAVLDGASNPKLLWQLAALKPESCCLFSGELDPELAATAPYLVRLERDKGMAEWLVGEGWDQHWGIFVVAAADLRAMRKHFKTLAMVWSPEGKPLYFRYYDPRVLRVFLPTCDAQQVAAMFGPISAYLAEAEDAGKLMRFTRDEDKVVAQEVPLASGSKSKA